MKIIHTIQELRELLHIWRAERDTIGFVPTMGFLHDGHGALMKAARQDNDRVVLSVFVNPTQFGENEDLEAYPRDLKGDAKLASSCGVDVIFAPTPEEMYQNPKAFVDIVDLSNTLCGVTRPIHFKGVCTVVTKLFNIVQPTRAYFGEKDAQQLAIIRKMVRDLNVPITIVGVPIVREADGLARSSRNTYLSAEERQAATILYKSIQVGKERIKMGMPASELVSVMKSVIQDEPLARIDYISVVDAETMQIVELIDRPVLVAMAVYIGETRLIDNFSYTIGR
ncbi:pantoate--beta-alanine ligase [Veillonella caviae]|uniref:pantoate--beta-alanine ligase n=1 Tax=Veillonella caviae TaxID=248316 RepID=UPI0023F932B0|nr:pantoate--beta-alanine ligase [Veillonella caviae]